MGLEGIVSPGNSPGEMTIDGNLTLAGGSSYLFEVNDASGSAGSTSGWDLLSVTGSTLITGTLGDSILFDLTSLSGTLPGEADNFNATQAYTWELLTAAGGISGNSTDFTLLTSSFQNDLAGGSFSLLQQGNSLNLVFNPFAEVSNAAVPEPSSLVLLGLGALGMLINCRRR